MCQHTIRGLCMARRWSYGRVGSGIPGCTSLVQGLPSEWVSVRDFLEALVGDGITGDLTGDIEPSSTTTRLTSPTAEPLLIEITSIMGDRKSTRLNSSHRCISYAVFCLKK